MSCVYSLWKWSALLAAVCPAWSQSILGLEGDSHLLQDLKRRRFYEVPDPPRDLQHIPVIVADLNYHLPAQPYHPVNVGSWLSSVVKWDT